MFNKNYILGALFILSSCSSSYQGKQTVSSDLKSSKVSEGEYKGCVSVPAKNFFQRFFVGTKSTGESCSVTVRKNSENKVEMKVIGLSSDSDFLPFFQNSSDPHYYLSLVNNDKNVFIAEVFDSKVHFITYAAYKDEPDVNATPRSDSVSTVRVCIMTNATCIP